MAFFSQSNQITSRGVVPTRARINRRSTFGRWRPSRHAHAGADNSVFESAVGFGADQRDKTLRILITPGSRGRANSQIEYRLKKLPLRSSVSPGGTGRS